jgi:thiamine biosynthesis lipoprotein
MDSRLTGLRTSDLTVGDGPARSRSTIAMDTFVSVHVASSQPADEVEAAIERALTWFARVERACSRFDPESELVRLCRQPGRAIRASELLFEALAFALELATVTRGAFDPTVGGRQQARGFNRNYATGGEIAVEVAPATYRDVRLDRRRRTVTLCRPLLLDLGAVAKGFAIDLAARELAHLERFAVEAGGDIFAGGAAPAGAPWRIGVLDPHRDRLLGALAVWNRAVCTSGGAERPAAAGGHHLLDPRTGASPRDFASVTVLAPTALVADALATAVFILGPDRGARPLAEQGLAGIAVGAGGEVRRIPESAGELIWLPSHE